MIAIFASFTFFGIVECTTSLSRTMPFINDVSTNDAPGFLSTFILSKSTLIFPSSFSTTDKQASTTTFARSLDSSATNLLIILVIAIFNKISLLLISTLIAIFFNISSAWSAALP